MVSLICCNKEYSESNEYKRKELGMIELNPKIKKAFLDINFVKRYEYLSNAFDKRL